MAGGGMTDGDRALIERIDTIELAEGCELSEWALGFIDSLVNQARRGNRALTKTQRFKILEIIDEVGVDE